MNAKIFICSEYIAEAFFSVLSEGCNLNNLKYFHIPIFFLHFLFTSILYILNLFFLFEYFAFLQHFHQIFVQVYTTLLKYL